MKKRCFISINLPKKVTNEIIRIQNQLKEKQLFKGKYTKTKNLHLTLKFLGEIDNNKINLIQSVLKKVKQKSPTATLLNIGIFSKKNPKIVWIKINNTNKLQKEIDNQLKNIFKPEYRFMSHITIARIKYINNKNLIKELKDIKPKNIKFIVNNFSLNESILYPEGPTYKNIEEYKLKN